MTFDGPTSQDYVPHLEGDAWWSLFNEARKNVRSLLLSTKTGLTTIDIMRDYGSFICKALPYVELGYPSVEEFLFAIPDVCQPVYGYGPLNRWLAATDSSCAQVHKLVLCQKDEKRQDHLPDCPRPDWIKVDEQGPGAAPDCHVAKRSPKKSPTPLLGTGSFHGRGAGPPSSFVSRATKLKDSNGQAAPQQSDSTSYDDTYASVSSPTVTSVEHGGASVMTTPCAGASRSVVSCTDTCTAITSTATSQDGVVDSSSAGSTGDKEMMEFELGEHVDRVHEKLVQIGRQPPPSKDELRATMETDPNIIARRKKQIRYGKNTQAYSRYIEAMPKSLRQPKSHPTTPSKFKKLSRRSFDSLIKRWKIDIATWDETNSGSLCKERLWMGKDVVCESTSASKSCGIGSPRDRDSAIDIGQDKGSQDSFASATDLLSEVHLTSPIKKMRVTTETPLARGMTHVARETSVATKDLQSRFPRRSDRTGAAFQENLLSFNPPEVETLKASQATSESAKEKPAGIEQRRKSAGDELIPDDVGWPPLGRQGRGHPPPHQNSNRIIPEKEFIPEDFSPGKWYRAKQILSNCRSLWEKMEISTEDKVSRFPSLYKSEFQEDLDLSMTGFHNICDLGLFLASQ